MLLLQWKREKKKTVQKKNVEISNDNRFDSKKKYIFIDNVFVFPFAFFVQGRHSIQLSLLRK